MTHSEAISEGLSFLAEYPNLGIPLSREELEGWTALLDMAGKTREGRYHPPMEWMVHACLVRTHGACVKEAGEEYMGDGHHLRRMGDHFFNVPGSIFPVEWNPNTVRIIDEFFQNKFLALMGCGNSGKSFSMAIIGALMFMVNPRFTKVLVTCTTVQAGEGKVWGDIALAWNQIEAVFGVWGLKVPGKLMSAPPMVRYQHPAYDPVKGWHYSFNSHKSGLELISTQQGSDKQTSANVQGYKNETVIFLGDEWDTFGDGLVETVTGNLQGNPESRCIASFNPSGRFSPGGKIATPKGGWDSVTQEDQEWEGVHGKVLRFDAERSANVINELNGDPKRWRGLATLAYIEERKQIYGEDSIGWWMYVKAWFPPTGESRFIYSELELTINYHADMKVTTWVETPKRVAGCDPSFTHGGDAAVLVILNVGQAQIGGVTRTVGEVHRVIDLDKFITAKDVTKDKQVILLIKKFMEDPECGFELKNLGVDVTGATSFGSMINELIGPGWIPIISGSKPSEKPVSRADMRKCSEVYEDLLSEMWVAPKALVRAGQLKGLDDETRREMCLRCYDQKGKQRGLVEVESKTLMKKRNRKMSPNRADALFLAIHVARMNHGLLSTEAQGGMKKHQAPLSPMQKFYIDNPQLKPKIPKWRPRPQPMVLKSLLNPW